MRTLFLKIIISPWLFIFTIWIFAPIKYQYEFPVAFFYVFLFVVSWLITVLSVGCAGCVWRSSHTEMVRIGFILKILFWFYVSCSYYNFYIVEGKSLFSLVAQRELANVEGFSPSVLGGVSALLASVPAFYLSYLFLSKERCFKEFFLISCCALVSVPPLLFSGGRNPIVLSFLFVVIFLMGAKKLNASRFFVVKKRSIPFKYKVMFVSSSISIFVYILFVASARRVVNGGLESYSYILHNDYNVVVTSIFDVLFDFSRSIAVSYTSLYYYITHGLVHFNHLLLESDLSYTLGFSTFPLYVIIVNYFLGFGLVERLSSCVEYKGSYLSLFGSVYQDFGFVGLFCLLFLLNIVFGFVFFKRKFTSVKLYWFSFVSLIVLIAPVYSLTSTGFGSSMLFVITIISIFARFKIII